MKYGIMGDNTSVDLPQMEIEETSLIEEKKMAKYSRSTEFKRIQDHFNDRITFYQTHLPDGRDVGSGQVPSPEEWLAANIIIGEFKLVLNMFEIANQAVKDSVSG